MSGMIRTSAAAVLSLAMFAVPLALNECAAACEVQLSAAAASEPSCHHAASSILRLSPIARSCGHDHTGAVTTVSPKPRPARADASFVSVAVMPLTATSIAAHHLISSSRPPGAGRAVGSPSLPLRI